ncbi:MAG TPA: CoA transferase, partial [Rhodospirillales bacterium]|nr:CoA transferase [Rhodospirillales bacterium]
PPSARAGIGREREGAGTRNACPHGHFPTRDGKWVAIACTTDKMFARLATAMDRPELAGDDTFGRQERRLAAREAVIALVGAWTGSLDRDEVMARCLAAEVPIGPLNTIADIFEDPQFEARGNLASIEDPELGPIVIPDVLPRLLATPGRIEHLGPPLGNANDAVYRGLLGLSEDEVAALARDRVI